MPIHSRILCLLAPALCAGLFASSFAYAGDNHAPMRGERFQFGLWGDMPYGKNGDGAVDGLKMTALVKSMNAAKLAFTIFDGDTKDGSSDCNDQTIGANTLKLFATLKAPAVYVLGDNEWTDCHRTNNGGHNALERLGFLRKTLYATPASLGQRKMQLTHQGAPGEPYSENTRWTRGGVVFVGLNVPGSNNNKVNDGKCLSAKSARTQADCDQDNQEYADRNTHNLAWLTESFKLARERHAAGVMVVIQADPVFDLPETEDVNERTATPNAEGYNDLLNTLASETRAFDGQVVLVHGDTHFFKIDKPLVDQAHLIENFTRVETFGSPNLHWIRVTVDPKNRNVFDFEPMLVPGN